MGILGLFDDDKEKTARHERERLLERAARAEGWVAGYKARQQDIQAGKAKPGAARTPASPKPQGAPPEPPQTPSPPASPPKRKTTPPTKTEDA